MKRWILKLCVLGLLVSSCSDEAKPVPDLRRVIMESWGEHIIIPTYSEFEVRAETLRLRSEELCEAPSVETLKAAQLAWWDAREPWKQMDVFAFGPYVLEPWRVGPRVDSWPVRVDSITQTLAADGPLEAEMMGVFQKGFPVADYLLHQPDVDLVAAFSDGESSNGRRCDYLLVVVTDIADGAKTIREAWDPAYGNYIGELTDAGRPGFERFSSLQMAMSEVVNRMTFLVENIRADKLGRPLGTNIGGGAQPGKVESQFSGRSVQDILDNLRGLERLYFGTGEEGSRGLEQFIASRGYDFDQAMRDNLAACREALGKIPGPLSGAVVSDPEAVAAAIEALGKLQRLIQVEMLNALSLTPSFNDNDGD